MLTKKDEQEILDAYKTDTNISSLVLKLKRNHLTIARVLEKYGVRKVKRRNVNKNGDIKCPMCGEYVKRKEFKYGYCNKCIREYYTNKISEKSTILEAIGNSDEKDIVKIEYKGILINVIHNKNSDKNIFWALKTKESEAMIDPVIGLNNFINILYAKYINTLYNVDEKIKFVKHIRKIEKLIIRKLKKRK